MCYRILIIMFLFVHLSSCSSDSDSNTQNLVLSDGLKIFVTSETHVGDFLNDPALAGLNAIEKADDFCMSSSDRPNDAIYKALLVDGINRDVVSLTNWVLLPNTKYYRAYNNILIGETGIIPIFQANFSDLDHSICSSENCKSIDGFDVWTGIEDAATFETTTYNCERWSVSDGSNGVFPYSASFGAATSTDGRAFSSSSHLACDTKASLYCVEQP